MGVPWCFTFLQTPNAQSTLILRFGAETIWVGLETDHKHAYSRQGRQRIKWQRIWQFYLYLHISTKGRIWSRSTGIYTKLLGRKIIHLHPSSCNSEQCHKLQIAVVVDGVQRCMAYHLRLPNEAMQWTKTPKHVEWIDMDMNASSCKH